MKTTKNIKIGYLPALLAVFVTFALGWASAGLIADMLQLNWLKWPLRIGFISGELLIVAWFLEPQKGWYTKKQLTLVKSAKYVLMGAGLIDGVLIIMAFKMGEDAPTAVYVGQAVVSIFAVFYCAAASMVIIDKDPDRIIAVEKATVRLENQLQSAKLELEKKKDEIETRRIQLKINSEIRKQVGWAAMNELKSPEVKAQLSGLGRDMSRAVISKFRETAQRKLRVYFDPPATGDGVGEGLPEDVKISPGRLPKK